MPQYLPAHILAAGEKDEVELFGQQAGVFLSAAGHHRNILRREAFSEDAFDHGAGGRRIGAGLYHSGIACGDGVGQRIYGQQKRIVPGAHDQGGSVRRRLLVAGSRELGQGRIDPAPGSKEAGVPDQIAEFA